MAVRAGEGPSFGHVDVLASGEHPTWGQHLIADMVSLDAASADEVPADCIDPYLRMTFDPIHALFGGALSGPPETRLVSVVDPGGVLRGAWRRVGRRYAASIDSAIEKQSRPRRLVDADR